MFGEVANYRSDCRCIFPNQSWVSPSAYFLGVASIVLSGIALKRPSIFGDPAPFIMELPPIICHSLEVWFGMPMNDVAHL